MVRFFAKVWWCAVIVAVATVVTLGSARAARLLLTEENDAFVADTDRHYTQGLRLSYLTDPIDAQRLWAKPFHWMSDAFGLFDPNARGAQRRIEWTVLGHSIFTPADIRRVNPDPADRPYAGWLYTGAALLQDHKTSRGSELESFEVLLGMVGPSALGRQIQNDFHTLIKVRPASGWVYQLSDEPGVMVTYERKWRYRAAKMGSIGVDVMPTAGATAGNVLAYAQVGTTVRIGQNLEADYGPAQVRPGVSGTAWFDEDFARGRVGWSLFLGAQGRLVARNIFLDGNSFAASRSVRKKALVLDVAGGASFWVSNIAKIDFTIVERSPEFKGQRGWDRYGMVSASLYFW